MRSNRRNALLALLIVTCFGGGGWWLATRSGKAPGEAAMPSNNTTGLMAQASIRSETVPSRERLPGDAYAGLKVLAERGTPRRGEQSFHRLRLIEKPDFKHPLLRIDEEISIQPDGTRRVASQTAYVADHVVFKPKIGIEESQILDRLKPLGAVIRKKMPASGIWLIAFPNVTLDTVPHAMREIKKMGDLAKIVEPDWVVQAKLVPNDTNFSTLWGMNNTGQSGGTADADIDAPEAWDLTTGSRTVLVGVIDSGIDYNHPDLAANIWTNPGEIAGNGIDDDNNGYIDDAHGWDFANDDNNSMDDNNHGTHCSGTIGGVGDNGNGVAGVNWQVSLVGLKFLDATGNGLISDATEATAYATELGVALTSNSWGGGGYSQAMKDAIDEADAAGILFVAAAGNDGANVEFSPSYPGGYDSPNVIAVAATTDTDSLASFSNYAATAVDLAAPGQSINSTIPNNSYAFFNGTSMATPHVSGACALLKAWYPALSHAEIKSIILRSVDPVPALNGFCATGGRLNVYQALLQSQEITTVPESPLIATMSIGGTPSPATKTYTLHNRSASSAIWTAAASESWVSLSLTSGTLVPGETFPLLVSFNSAVQTLTPGVYEATVTITNNTSGRSETRAVSIEVVPPVLIADDLDVDPGWPMNGEWAFGTPLGGGAIDHGFPDPISGATGTNVIGVNLAGDYSLTPGGPYYVTAGPFDLTSRDHTQLQFERWLNTDAGDWAGAWVEVSNDGTNWDRLWTNIGGTSDDAWTTQRYDISTTADEQPNVWIRWGYDVKNIADVWALSGWNIDDIKILGTQTDRLAVTGPETITEGDPNQNYTVSVTPPPVDDLTVTLTSSAPTQATVPATATILAGQTSAQFPLSAVDDSLADGTQSVTITASTADHESGTFNVKVHDNEVRALTVALPASITEGAGIVSGQATVSVDAPVDADVWVTLTSNDPGELSVPPAVMIPSGSLSANFDLTVSDDILLDGTQTVTVTTMEQGWNSGTTMIDVIDNEVRTLTVALPSSVQEGQLAPAQGSISLAGVTPVALEIFLESDDSGEVAVPANVTLPAGASSVQFALVVGNDAEVDGDQLVTITANASTFFTGSASVTIHDDESPAQPGNPQPFNAATQVHPDSDLSWSDVVGTGGTPDSYDVYLGTVPLPGTTEYLGNTTDHNWPLPRLTPGTEYFWRVIAHKGAATNAGPVWHFSVPPIGPPVRYEWSAIPPSLLVSQPAPATVTAYDAFDNVSTGFNEATSLSLVQPRDSIVISEVNANTPDAIEFTNVSDADIDVSGWVISLYDGDVWPGRKAFTIPNGTVCAPGQTFVLEEFGVAPGAFPHFYTGANINWLTDPLSAVAVLIAKPDGTMIDFVCATLANPNLISTPAIIPSSQWSGPTLSAPVNLANSYVRIGSADQQTADDWSETAPAVGTLDPTLEIPFWGNEYLTAVAPTTAEFVNGVWNSTFNVRQALADVRARITDAEGHTGHSNAFTVSSAGALALTVTATAYNEDSGSVIDALTVTLPAPSVDDVSITITSSDPTEIASQTLLIPSGQTSLTATLTILDDAQLDGTQHVELDASAIGYEPAVVTIDVNDNETSTLTLTLPAAVNEADGVLIGQGTVSVPVAVDGDVEVALASSDPTELTLPATATIPAGQTSGHFDLTVVQDDLLDGTQAVSITASVINWTSGVNSLNVTDDEQEIATLEAPASVYEGQGILPTGLIVHIGGIAVTEVEVALASSDESELIVPALVTVPVGQSSVSVPLTVVDDGDFDGLQTVTINATAFGSAQLPAQLSVLDNDAASFEFSPIPSPQKEGVGFAVTISAHDSNGDLITVPVGGPISLAALASATPVALTPTAISMPSGTWTGQVRVLEAATDVHLEVASPTAAASSNLFDVTMGPRLTYSPGSFEITLPAQTIKTRTLTLANEGAEPLSWSLSSSYASILSASPDFQGSPTSESKEAARVAATDDRIYHMPMSASSPSATVSLPERPLLEVLTLINAKHAELTALIPNAYAFTDGVTGTNILDGGDDMYDNGNYLTTNLNGAGTYLSYSDNTIITSSALGSGGKYFTKKQPKLFVFAADLGGVSQFNINGNLGADGSGSVNGTVMSATLNGITYTGMVKRVFGAGDPSVNHLVVVRQGAGMTNEFSTNTDNDYQRIAGLNSTTRIYYLLFASGNGGQLTDPQTQALFQKFIEIISPLDWASVSPSAGTIPVGGSQDVTVSFNSTGLDPGTYTGELGIASDDARQPQVHLPMTMHVTRPVDHLVWDNVASPQSANEPFTATLRAMDDTGAVVVGFDGTASIAAFNEASAGEVTTGAGTGQTFQLLDTSYRVHRTECLYTPAELGGAGRLAGMGVDVASIGTPSTTNLTIRLKHSLRSSFSAGSQWDATGWTTVFSGPLTATLGWNQIPFLTAFDYDGSHNLLVDVSFVNATASFSTNVRCTTVTPARVLLAGAASGDPLTWSGTSPAGSTSSLLPSLRFNRVGVVVPSSPSTTTAFVEGVWTGPVTVGSLGAVRLTAKTSAGKTGESNSFSVSSVGTLTITTPASVTEGGGLLAAAGTVTVDPAPAAGLTVTLTTTPVGGLSLPATVVIPNGQTSASFDLTVLDNLVLDGQHSAECYASAIGHPTASSLTQIADNESTTITVGAVTSLAEGTSSATASVTLGQPASADLVIALTSSLPTRLAVPASVIIPTGQSGTTFTIVATDNTQVDGTGTAIITATLPGSTPGTKSVQITDNENRNLNLTLFYTTLTEGDAPVPSGGYVSLSGTTPTSVTISLASSDTTELLVPATVTVSAGSSSSNYFSLTAVDDVIFDGTQSVTLTASAATFVNASKTLTIQDNDVLSLSVTLPPALSEGAGTNAGQGTVSIGVETASLIDVALASSSPARLSIPASVSIAPGQSSATFALSPIDDRIAEGDQVVTITATHSALNGTGSITLTDDEPQTATAVKSEDGLNYLMFTYRRLLPGSGQQSILEVSSTLQDWHLAGEEAEQLSAVPTGDGTTETVIVRILPAITVAPQKFVRVRTVTP